MLFNPNLKGKFNKKLVTALENSIEEVVYNITGKLLTSVQIIQLLPNIIQKRQFEKFIFIRRCLYDSLLR